MFNNGQLTNSNETFEGPVCPMTACGTVPERKGWTKIVEEGPIMQFER
jgi:hypothetical protein